MVRHHHCPPYMEIPDYLLHPTVLYHASPFDNIEEFDPSLNKKKRDQNEEPSLFATPDKSLATIFLTPTDDSWVSSGLHNNIPYMVISNRDRFLELDKGGVIYELPVDTFKVDLEKGLREYEWTSREVVKPIGKQVFKTSLEAMLDAGVQVYFIDEETFKEMKGLPGPEKMKKKMTLTSENQRLDRNYKPFTTNQ